LKVKHLNYRCEFTVHKEHPTFQKYHIDRLLAERTGYCGCHIHNSGLSSTGNRMWQSPAVLHTADKRQLEHDATIVRMSSELGGLFAGTPSANTAIGKSQLGFQYERSCAKKNRSP
jgi:hypothetical protein